MRFALLEVPRDPGDKETVLDVLLVPCTGELSRRAYLDLVAILRGLRTVRGALAGISRAGRCAFSCLRHLVRARFGAKARAAIAIGAVQLGREAPVAA